MSEARGRSGRNGRRVGLSFTHHALFRDEAARERRCDVCECAVSARPTDDDTMPSGAGLYVWTRGDEVRYEERPLCPSCGAALGMAQVRRWEIEDDEEG
jgi:hypothetical protein